jgi:hypothetical protein
MFTIMCAGLKLFAFVLYKMYNMYMKILTTTNLRREISSVVNRVRDTGEVFGIGRRDAVEVLVIPFPAAYRKNANDITNINAYSRSFDFLADEPELYSRNDVKKYA